MNNDSWMTLSIFGSLIRPGKALFRPIDLIWQQGNNSAFIFLNGLAI